MTKPSVAIVANDTAKHQLKHAQWISDGFSKHGYECRVIPRESRAKADFYVTWGWRNGKARRQQTNKPVLVMERGYLDNRFAWTSLGWNGLNNRAIFPDLSDPSRWRTHFQHLMQEKKPMRGAALIMGQVAGDAALENVSIRTWYIGMARKCFDLGYVPVFRQHPVERSMNIQPPVIPNVLHSDLSLEMDLKRAGLAITYNSNSAVDAILAGVPAYVADEGSMAWPVRSETLELPTLPDRAEWAYRLAWKQWQESEIRDGTAIEAVMTVFPG